MGCSNRSWVALLTLFVAFCACAPGAVEGGGLFAGGLPPPPLTSLGRDVRRVIFAGLLPGLCKSDDWRGELPRWFSSFFPKARTYTWNSRHWTAGEKVLCRECSDSRYAVSQSRCDAITKDGIGPGDVLVVVGGGNANCAKYRNSFGGCSLHSLDPRRYPTLWDMKKLVRPGAVTMHFPVRRLNVFTKNALRWDHVVQDDSFFKPLGDSKGDGPSSLKHCASEPKKHDLIYIARYKPYKGQLGFLHTADPALLKDFTVHFFGSSYHENNTWYPREIERVAQAKGIRVKVHASVPKGQLMAQVCRSSGGLLWTSNDNNPRAAYEPLYAGNPVFMSDITGVPPALFDLPFVFSTKYIHNPAFDTAEFNQHLKTFLEYASDVVASSKYSKRIQRYASHHLNPYVVYRDLCVRAGLCRALPPLREDSDNL